jgi:hypothetical protein
MVKLALVQKYTSEEYEILKRNILFYLQTKSEKDHNGKPILNKPGLLTFLEHILKNPNEEIVSCWLNASCKLMMYKAPIDHMPLCLNSKKMSTRYIASWRLRINK